MKRRIKKRTITVAGVVEGEILLDVPSVLPTTSPSDAQISLTLTDEMMYKIEGEKPVGAQSGVYLHLIFGKTNGTTATATFAVFINGAATNITAQSVALTNSATLQGVAHFAIPAKAGDIITIKAWQNSAGVISLHGLRYAMLPIGFCSSTVKRKNFSVFSIKVITGANYNVNQIGRAIVSVNFQSLAYARKVNAINSAGNVNDFDLATISMSTNYAYNGVPMSTLHDEQHALRIVIPVSVVVTSSYAPETTIYLLKQYMPTKLEVRYID